MNLRIAIPSLDNTGLTSPVSEHFGRCSHFTLVDIEASEIKSVSTIDNPYAHSHAPGQVPQFVHEHGANVMLAGGLGHRAITFFEQYGIQVATGAQGTVQHTVQAYLAGQLNGATPCADSQQHH